MRQQLDKEMPVAEKRRRFGGWWIIAVLLGLALVSTLVLFNKEQPPSDSIDPVASKTETKTESLHETLEVENRESAMEDKPNYNSSINYNSSASFDQPNNAEIITSNSNSTNVPFENNNSPQVAEGVYKDKIILNNTGFNLGELDINTKNNSLDHSSGSAEEISIEDFLVTLPPLKTGISSIKGKSTLSVIEPVIPLTPKFEASLYLSVMTGVSSSLEGLATGLLFKHDVGKSRFSFETGIGYSYMRQPVVFVVNNLSPTIDLNTLGIEGPEFGFENSDINSDFSGAEHGVEWTVEKDFVNLHYLQIPFLINYQFRRFRFSTGLNTDILLANDSDIATGGILPFRDKNNSSNSIYNALEAYDKKPNFNNLNLFANAGMGIDLSSRIAIECKYRKGLNDALLSNKKKDKNSILQASLRIKI